MLKHLKVTDLEIVPAQDGKKALMASHLHKAIRDAGLTQAEAAAMIGQKRTRLSNWANGKARPTQEMWQPIRDLMDLLKAEAVRRQAQVKLNLERRDPGPIILKPASDPMTLVIHDTNWPHEPLHGQMPPEFVEPSKRTVTGMPCESVRWINHDDIEVTPDGVFILAHASVFGIAIVDDMVKITHPQPHRWDLEIPAGTRKWIMRDALLEPMVNYLTVTEIRTARP